VIPSRVRVLLGEKRAFENPILSANIGEHVAMFEAIHGSAPDVAGKGIANPSGPLLAAVMMLVHIRQASVATRIHIAWLTTLEDGVFTADPQGQGQATIGRPFASMDFADAVIERLIREPKKLKPVQYVNAAPTSAKARPLYTHAKSADKKMVGVDVFIHDAQCSAEFLAGRLSTLATPPLQLQMITNRSVKVWPVGFPETFCADHWRCRFLIRKQPKPTTESVES